LRQRDRAGADAIFSDEDRQRVVALHNGWKGFLYPFLLPTDYTKRIFGMDHFLRSGKPGEIYKAAGFDAEGLRAKLL
jgi:transketolase